MGLRFAPRGIGFRPLDRVRTYVRKAKQHGAVWMLKITASMLNVGGPDQRWHLCFRSHCM